MTTMSADDLMTRAAESERRLQAVRELDQRLAAARERALRALTCDASVRCRSLAHLPVCRRLHEATQ